jgi:hypothetical protein
MAVLMVQIVLLRSVTSCRLLHALHALHRDKQTNCVKPAVVPSSISNASGSVLCF